MCPLIGNECLRAPSALIDDVRIGLPAEYLQAIVEGVDDARRVFGTVADGRLIVSYGASRVIYGH